MMSGKKIKVGVVGSGAMGRAIAYQVATHPKLELNWVADQNLEAAQKAIKLAGYGIAGNDCLSLLKENPIDVLVEATNAIGEAARYCFAAFSEKTHVVLMNAEVDLALRPLLENKARENNVTVTSDAGDQHGVLAVMIEEAIEMGFDIVQAGNIKGFLDNYATPESIKSEADKRNLSAEQCCAYTDGSKLHIEMAMLANAYGYLPPAGGMTGPSATTVQEALSKFDFKAYGDTPRIDYILGADPGGGVYLVVKPQKDRPYHLCHLETPKAIKLAVDREPLLPFDKKVCEVYAYAKRELNLGEQFSHGIGSAEVYGKVAPVDPNLVPMVILEGIVKLKANVPKDALLTWDDIELSPSLILDYWNEQSGLS